jgi:DNA-binding NarL/FixJ family response regulator
MTPPKFINPLTPREMEIMHLILKEYSNRFIAEKLHLSPSTVETHRRNIFQKLNIRSPLALLRWAAKHNLEKL